MSKVITGMMSFCNTFSLSLLVVMLLSGNAFGSTFKDSIDDWLAPELAAKREKVSELLALKEKEFEEGVKRMPEADPNVSWGREHKPGGMEHQLLSVVKMLRGSKQERILVADLGCGLGYLASLVVLAGGTVDAVEFPKRAKLANQNIFRSTESVIGYRVSDATRYYATHGCSLLQKEPPLWTTKPHEIIYSFNVVHYFTETQIRFFAKRVFDNLQPGGCFAVTTDAPFWCQGMLDYYLARRGQFACPGMGIYSIKKNGRLDYESHIIPYDPIKYSIKPGYFNSGIFREDGTIEDVPGWKTYFFSPYMLEDLVAIFESVGLKVSRKFYLNDAGQRLPDEKLLTVNTIAKTCIYFLKPEE